jgi:hypothetical protein
MINQQIGPPLRSDRCENGIELCPSRAHWQQLVLPGGKASEGRNILTSRRHNLQNMSDRPGIRSLKRNMSECDALVAIRVLRRYLEAAEISAARTARYMTRVGAESVA